MHDNAAITKEIGETNDTLGAILSTMNQAGGSSNDNTEEIFLNLANSILADVPAPYNIDEAEEAFPVSYSESMNTVLT